MLCQNQLKNFGSLDVINPQHLRCNLFTFRQKAKDLMSWGVERSSYDAKVWNIWQGQLFMGSS